MFKHVFVFVFLSTILFAACQKDALSTTATTSDELQTQTAGVENLSAGKVVSTAHWYGSYTGVTTGGGDPDGNPPNGDPDADPDGNPAPGIIVNDASQVFVSDSNFIKNGIAELPSFPNQFAFSNISFDIPSTYNISGDSLIFEVVVKNPTVGSFFDYDVVLQLFGSQHSANLHFVADPSGQQFTDYTIGTASYTNLSALVNYFGDFKTIKFVLKKDQTAAYVNNGLIYKFTYGSSNRIGRLQSINIAGKGYVIVDNVKLTNSITNKKILSESFNINGQSHTIFY